MMNSLKRSTTMASTLVISWFVVPVALSAAAFSGFGLPTGLAIGSIGLVFWFLMIWRIASRSSPYVFKGTNFLWRIDRLVEHSFLGVGALDGWTRSNPSISLADLRLGETQVVASGVPSAETVRPQSFEYQPPAAALPSAPVRNRRPVAVVTTSKPPAETLTVAVPETAIEYVVCRGDTYWSLAERLWGDGSRWKEIQDLNAGRVVSVGVVLVEGCSLVPGWKILLPEDLGERR